MSPLSFTTGLGKSYNEGILKRRTGDFHYYGNCCKIRICCDKLKLTSSKRWFCLKETYIACLNQNNQNHLSFPILIDMDFSIEKGIKSGTMNGILIKNSQKSLVIKCKSRSEQHEWYESIENLIKTDGSDFCTKQRFSSFVPERQIQICKWFVNGEQYMEHVLAGINAAKEEIFITDWWFSPELHLKRPSNDLENRLDKILQKKAVNLIIFFIFTS